MINHLNNGLGAAQLKMKATRMSAKTVQHTQVHIVQWRNMPAGQVCSASYGVLLYIFICILYLS